jgi:pimeloyl-ACP methyl ester carboxylesterase
VADPTERGVTGAGVELAVRQWGDPTRPVVVLVHGFPDTSAVWTPVAEALVDHGFHAVAYDVRGAGASGAPADLAGYGLDRLVTDLHAVVDAVSPDRPVHLVGHDWGSIQGWEAATAEELAGRLASFTSISGPPLDHVGLWMRDRARRRDLVTLLRQGTRSSYVAAFHLPGAARVAWLLRGPIGRTRGAWSKTLARVDGARVDADWPAPTFGTDVAQGMGLYRANFRPKLRHPVARRAHVPVQLVIPVNDRFVPAWLFDGIEVVAPDLRRREVQARHWIVRSQPIDVAAWIAAFAQEVDARSTAETDGAREVAG